MDKYEVLHEKLVDDLGYIFSVENEDVYNMQIVLRAYGEDFLHDEAVAQIEVGKKLGLDLV